MRKALLAITLTLSLVLHAGDYTPRDLVWTTPSKNSSESMPCGGHDIGMNIWVEDGDLLFYISQSGWFDENNTLLKAGRWRLHFEGDPFGGADFEQRLCLDEGWVGVKGGGVEVSIWADTSSPNVFVDITSRRATATTLSYESWRHRDRPVSKAECQQCSYKWQVPSDCVTRADSIIAEESQLTFIHKNLAQTVFDYTVAREGLEAIKDGLYNPIGNKEMRGTMFAPHFRFSSSSEGSYASTDHHAWQYLHPRLRHATITITLDNGDNPTPPIRKDARISRRASARWWHDFWQRSWITTDGSNADAARMVRNYELMRYLLGCNAHGQWPTKYNGGLFTFDPEYVEPPKGDGTPSNPFTPDYRKWGGGTMTAQNQRLVYWPMVKSGDYDLLSVQLDTYLRLLPTAVARTRHYWGHGGASFTEQMENFGLPNPAEYGKHPEGSDPGVENNAWLEYEWDTALEFGMMALQAASHSGDSSFVTRYAPLVDECLRFFDEHYQYQALRLGAKSLDEHGRLVIYPGSGCETYKMAYNPSSTIAALRAVTSWRKEGPLPMERIPDIPLRVIDGDTCISPAVTWARIQNTETPQLYPVFPWRLYGMGREGLEISRNTYLKDPHAVAMRDTKGWKQDNIWAACLGLVDEARRLNNEKLADGPYRYPAFWDAGFDWAPDLNRGGAAMTGLQEMLLQEAPDGTLLPFPAWPKEWNVHFRLHATGHRVVEGEMRDGNATWTVLP
ncbi:MAG: hypothetical protein J5548_12805 [Prevotella sp.]|nr:hypothetical protein [Prevotella sp.]